MTAAESPAAAPRPAPGAHDREAIYVDGRWRRVGGPPVPVHDSGTEAILGRVRSASLDDLEAAVVAARRALPTWSATTPGERAAAIDAVVAALGPRTAELTALISAEVGTTTRMCDPIQVASAMTIASETARLARQFAFRETIGNATVVLEPVGVAAAITPWNYPLFQTMAKVAAALAAGATIVHKPSGLAPLSTFVLAEAIDAAGLPAGVYNLVTGPGETIGAALAAHPDVDMVSFTGSTAAGIRVGQAAGASVKRVALELGGKSASVVLEDADLPKAVKATVNRAMLNSGQTCDAWTRLLVPRSRLDDALDLAAAAAERLTLGDPFDPASRLGPLVSADQVARVRGHVDRAIAAGATVVIGGSEPPAGIDRGYYVRPTILSNVTPQMEIAREEVFGPVLVVLAYEDEDHAVEIANATEYGLSGAVWSADDGRAEAIARRLRTGQVVVNGGAFNPIAPVGGVKRSGLGRELGAAGIAEYLEPKTLVR
jgi:aldehyde dehydrogenase (NAD+)